MRALVIDDSRATRAILRRMLEGFDAEVLEAGDGREGLEVYAREQPLDVILVDWNMPIMDGLTFVRSVRAEHCPDRPVLVMVTSESSSDHLRRALEAGADEYAMKPFTAAVIRDKLRMLGVEV